MGGGNLGVVCRGNVRARDAISVKDSTQAQEVLDLNDGWCGEAHESRVADLMKKLRRGQGEKEFTRQTRYVWTAS